jgi:hypothetical protein
VLIDTSADEHYDGTGIQRVHRAGIELSPLSSSAAPDRVVGPYPRKDMWAITPGIQWKSSADDRWRGLAQYHIAHSAPKGEEPDAKDAIVKSAGLDVTEEKPDRVAFTVKYDLAGDGARAVEEALVLTKDGVEGVAGVPGGEKPAATRVLLPAFVHDGEKDFPASVAGNKLTTHRGHAEMSLDDHRAVRRQAGHDRPAHRDTERVHPRGSSANCRALRRR